MKIASAMLCWLAAAPLFSAELAIEIDSRSGGAPVAPGLSGFNTNTPGQGLGFDHPVFVRETVAAQPGGLRFVAGTLSDPFNWRTGLYEEEWIEQLSHGDTLHARFAPARYHLIGKGGASLAKFNDLTGAAGAQLIVCLNTFTDTPRSAGDLAKFCLDSNIVVDCFQLGNEPNFNMGGKVFASAADYVKRMQAFAHAIKAADPNAKIGLSLGWDNGQDLLAAAKAFPDKYWDIATHHSYKPHVSKPEDFAKARARADAGLDTLASRETIEARMASMPGGMPIMITEVGVWNKALDNAYGSLYLAEYVARMAANPEIRFIGIHQQWQMFMPANMYNKEVGEAGRLGRVLDLSPIDIPVTYPESAQALRIVNAAINDAIWTCDSRFSGGDAPEKLYARAFQGASGRDYLVVVNHSAQAYELTLSMDRSPLSQPMRQEFLWAPKADGPMAGDRQSLDTKNPVRIEPFSVNRIEWNSGIVRPPRATRIYKAEIAAGQAALRWWKRGEAAGYRIHYGEAPGAIGETIDAGRATEAVIGGLKENGRYFFRVIAYNQAGESSSSNEVDAVIAPPPSPDAPELAAGDGRIKAEWRSVPYAGGYRLYCRSEDGDTQCIDAGMMCGAVIRQLSNGKRYSFSVAAYNGAGESEESAAVSASPRAGIPFPPRSLKAVRSNGAVELSWSPSFASPAESYIVERSAMPTEGFAAIAEGVTGTGYLDKDAPREGDCYYRLIGVGGGMRSQYPSNAAAAMPAGAASRE